MKHNQHLKTSFRSCQIALGTEWESVTSRNVTMISHFQQLTLFKISPTHCTCIGPSMSFFLLLCPGARHIHSFISVSQSINLFIQIMHKNVQTIRPCVYEGFRTQIQSVSAHCKCRYRYWYVSTFGERLSFLHQNLFLYVRLHIAVNDKRSSDHITETIELKTRIRRIRKPIHFTIVSAQGNVSLILSPGNVRSETRRTYKRLASVQLHL